jgi:hypothetical protein
VRSLSFRAFQFILFAASQYRLAGLRTGDGHVKKKQRFPKIRRGIPGYVFSAPTKISAGARPSGRFTVRNFLGLGNSATSQGLCRTEAA